MYLSKHDLFDGLTALGQAAVAAGKIIDLAIYGGSCLMLVSNFRDASQDVDAVASTDQSFIDRVASEIADRNGWPRDWLNDGVRVYLSPVVDGLSEHDLIGTYPSEQAPGLRVYVPTPEYMLAMKLMALRIDDVESMKDLSDIDNLLTVVGIESRDALLDVAAAYYPEARISAKLILAADRLLASARQQRENADHVAPRYLDRRGESGAG